ncbi:OmpA/MotB family protein [Clostridium sp. 'White wine YQ']|uniref:OmpA/MotB family protein n=1 Tax=Clostridium sp. 'White wine YQ' TaxID=3027474 RepID=UPI0023664263|nr:OmpA family protein [Clostridium sp. 'White wine YQ']MDD7794592.1 OmpA family protein [Clostridium sp. 'White wine YQ']
MVRKRKNRSGQLSGDEWLGTFSHTIMIILIFFILLFSFSSVSENKLKGVSEAFKDIVNGGGTTILSTNQGTPESDKGSTSKVTTEEDTSSVNTNKQMLNKVNDLIKQNNLGSVTEVKSDKRGIIIELKDTIFFESEKADLIPDSKNVLDKLSTLLSSINNEIIIEGHTDNVPINNYKFSSNWELSSIRAVNIVRYFTEVKKLEPSRFQASGYGEFRPLVDNSTPENRAKNRRVNILIVATNKGE